MIGSCIGTTVRMYSEESVGWQSRKGCVCEVTPHHHGALRGWSIFFCLTLITSVRCPRTQSFSRRLDAAHAGMHALREY